MEETVNINISKATRKRLRLISAETGEKLYAVVDRLAIADLERIEEEKQNEETLKKPEDE